MTGQLAISFVVPAYNEEKHLARTLTAIVTEAGRAGCCTVFPFGRGPQGKEGFRERRGFWYLFQRRAHLPAPFAGRTKEKFALFLRETPLGRALAVAGPVIRKEPTVRRRCQFPKKPFDS